MKTDQDMYIPDNQGEDEEYEGPEMTLTEHLAELRSRLIRAGLGVVVGMVISFLFVQHIVQALLELIKPHTPLATGITEKFTTYMKVAFIGGIAIAMPLIVYQLIAFISPGLTKRERRFVLRALPFVTLLFVTGVIFGYFIVLPTALRFLLGFGSEDIATMPRFADYIGFVSNLLLWVGLSFETPVIVYVLIKANIVSVQRLTKLRKYAFVVILIAAAIITPTPDPMNMMIVATPMYLLYELGILMGRIW